MLVNLQGRVNNIKLAHQHGLHPLFEAIINSIHAIEEQNGAGQINVHLRRRIFPSSTRPWRLLHRTH